MYAGVHASHSVRCGASKPLSFCIHRVSKFGMCLSFLCQLYMCVCVCVLTVVLLVADFILSSPAEASEWNWLYADSFIQTFPLAITQGLHGFSYRQAVASQYLTSLLYMPKLRRFNLQNLLLFCFFILVLELHFHPSRPTSSCIFNIVYQVKSASENSFTKSKSKLYITIYSYINFHLHFFTCKPNKSAPKRKAVFVFHWLV